MRLQAQIPAFIITVPGREERLNFILDQFSSLEHVLPQISPGVDGSQLADTVCFLLTRHHDWDVKSAIAGFMSHLKAWEAILENGAAFALVLEDHVDVSSLDEISTLDLEDDAELIYLASNMAGRNHGTSEARALPMRDYFHEMDQRRIVMGSEAYLVSRSAVSKLVQTCKEDTLFGYVGGRLLRYCSMEDDLNKFGANTWLAGVLKDHHHYAYPPKFGMLKGYWLSQPIVYHRSITATP